MRKTPPQDHPEILRNDPLNRSERLARELLIGRIWRNAALFIAAVMGARIPIPDALDTIAKFAKLSVNWPNQVKLKQAQPPAHIRPYQDSVDSQIDQEKARVHAFEMFYLLKTTPDCWTCPQSIAPYEIDHLSIELRYEATPS